MTTSETPTKLEVSPAKEDTVMKMEDSPKLKPEVSDEESKPKKRPRTPLQIKILSVTTFVAILVVVPYAWYATRINTYSHANKDNETVFPEYSQLWITGVSALVFSIMHSLPSFFREYTMKVIPSKAEGKELSQAERLDKAKKFEEHLYLLVSYTILVVSGFWICKDQDWMPTYMGGEGALENGFVNIPFLKVDNIVLVYGLISFGHRIEALLKLLFVQKWGGDFVEYLLHDMVTVFLFYGYIFSNFLPVGTVIAILHDVCDIPVHICKGSFALGRETVSAIFFLITQVFWVYFRFYCLGTMIMKILTLEYPADHADFNPFIKLNAIFLSMLLMLHILWFGLMQMVNYKILTKGTEDVTYQDMKAGEDQVKKEKEEQSDRSLSTQGSFGDKEIDKIKADGSM